MNGGNKMNFSLRNAIAFLLAWTGGGMACEGFVEDNQTLRIIAYLMAFLFYFVVEKKEKNLTK